MFEFSPDQLQEAPLVAKLAVLVVSAIIQDDLACITTGFYVASGMLPFWPAMGACLLGTYLGDVAYVILGRLALRLGQGSRVVRRLMERPAIARGRDLLTRFGVYVIIGSRFLPGLRTPIQLATGVLYPNLLRACIYQLIACCIYAPMMVGGSAALGTAVEVEKRLRDFGHISLVATAVGVWLLILLVRSIARWSTQRDQGESTTP